MSRADTEAQMRRWPPVWRLPERESMLLSHWAEKISRERGVTFGVVRNNIKRAIKTCGKAYGSRWCRGWHYNPELAILAVIERDT